MQEYPQFESAEAIYVELNPGETLYIPSFWFHRIDGKTFFFFFFFFFRFRSSVC